MQNIKQKPKYWCGRPYLSMRTALRVRTAAERSRYKVISFEDSHLGIPLNRFISQLENLNKLSYNDNFNSLIGPFSNLKT